MIRVLLAEDHKMVRQATRLYLESMGLEVVGEATTGREAVELTRALLPDVVIMDIHLPELTGIEATRRIRHEHEQVRVLALTAYSDPAYVYALLDAGADGFVLKTAALSELLTAVQDVAVGRQAFDPAVVASAGPREVAPMEALTSREVEVLTEAARGLTNKQIGAALFLSDRTVQGHLQNIYQKLNVTTRTEAVTTGLALGLIALANGDAP